MSEEFEESEEHKCWVFTDHRYARKEDPNETLTVDGPYSKEDAVNKMMDMCMEDIRCRCYYNEDYVDDKIGKYLDVERLRKFVSDGGALWCDGDTFKGGDMLVVHKLGETVGVEHSKDLEDFMINPE